MYVSSGLLRAFDDHGARGQRRQSALSGARSTPTIRPSMRWSTAIFEALSHVIPAACGPTAAAAARSSSAGAAPMTGKGYVQYEIVGGGAGARASRDGASGTTVNQTNAKIAPVEIIESEFPTRVLRFELIRDSGGAGAVSRRPRHPARISQSRGGAVLHPLGQARDRAQRLRGRRTTAAPATSGSIPTPTTPSACRRAMPTIRCRRATSSGSIRRAAAAMAIRCGAIPRACSPTCAKADVSPEAAAKPSTAWWSTWSRRTPRPSTTRRPRQRRADDQADRQVGR